jgi:hypothetical protein
MRDPPFQLQERTEVLFGKGLVDDAVSGSVHARIGDRIEPMPELAVEVVEIAERAREEEVLADVPIGPLDLSLGFGRIWPARLFG